MYVENHFGTDTAELQEEFSGNRIGRRIRRIREECDPSMSQGALGTKIGLNANRIQQYENGARTPKLDLLKKLAEALGVETAALADPDTSNYIGVMYALFEMEELFGLMLVENEDGQIYLSFGKNEHVTADLKAWYKARKALETALRTSKTPEERAKALHDYHMWEWTFPKSLARKDPDKIKSQIEQLQQQIAEMQATLDDSSES